MTAIPSEPPIWLKMNRALVARAPCAGPTTWYMKAMVPGAVRPIPKPHTPMAALSSAELVCGPAWVKTMVPSAVTSMPMGEVSRAVTLAADLPAVMAPAAPSRPEGMSSRPACSAVKPRDCW